MKKVKCINNKNWFGTLGKYYDILCSGVKVLKDITYTGNRSTFRYYTVIDDMKEEVDVKQEWFE